MYLNVKSDCRTLAPNLHLERINVSMDQIESGDFQVWRLARKVTSLIALDLPDLYNSHLDRSLAIQQFNN